MCSACKDEPACECSSQECTASQGRRCTKCGHESSSPQPSAPSEPPPMGWLMPSGDVTFAHAQRRRHESFIASISSGYTGVPMPPYYDNLMAMAVALVKERRNSLDYGIAVILCQMAAELVGEIAITALAKRKKRRPPKDILFNGRYVSGNLTNKKVRRFY